MTLLLKLKQKSQVFFIFFSLNFLITQAFALQIGPVFFNDIYTKNSLQMRLNGAGLKKFIAIKIVAVGLFLPDDVNPQDVLKDTPKHLEVVYLQNIPREELQNATRRGVEANYSESEYKKLKNRIDQMNSYYPDVKKNDRIEVTYLPGQGTKVALNGEYKGTVKGADFAEAFFAIWVGENPVDTKIKQQLLGKEDR